MEAADAWSDQSSRAEAESKYGHMSMWNTRAVTYIAARDATGEAKAWFTKLASRHDQAERCQALDEMPIDASVMDEGLMPFGAAEILVIECIGIGLEGRSA